jgi:hypothetical protein
VLVASGATGDTIGGTAAGAGNVIAHNRGAGVAVGSSATDSSVNNGILSNTIFSNGRLGIDLGSDGVTLNTPGGPHTGPNLLENFPAITSANVSGGSTTIMGTLDGAPNMNFTIQFFASAAPDPTGYGQGQQFLGQVTATTNGSGNASFLATLTIPSLVGQFFRVLPGGRDHDHHPDICPQPVHVRPVGDLHGHRRHGRPGYRHAHGHGRFHGRCEHPGYPYAHQRNGHHFHRDAVGRQPHDYRGL